MNEQQYIEQRLDDQIQWYEQKSLGNQRLYKLLRVSEICCAAVIPLLVGFITESSGIGNGLKMVVGALGAIIAILSGVQSLFRFQENWLQYRATAEALKREKIFFQTKTGLYSGEDAFNRLVQQAETIMGSEQSSWVKLSAATQETKSTKP